MIRFAAMLALAAAAWAQQTPMERLKVEAEKARVAVQPDGVVDDIGPVIAAQRLAFRDWMESRLPEKRRTLAGEWETLGADMDAALGSAGLKAAETEDSKFGYAGLRTHWFPELPDVLFVVASVSIPCGTDDTVYAYRFTPQGRTRILEDHPKAAFGYYVTDVRLSEPDAQGRRLLLTTRMSSQCASMWMGLAYDVYRVGVGLPKQLLAEQHSTYMGEDRLEYVLEPERLWVELVDASVGIDIPFSRTQVHGYDLSGARARRIEPVALQPQDFAEEWMTRPWPEMQTVSDPATAEFHEQLAADYLSGEYIGLGTCDGQNGITVVGMQFDKIGKKSFDPALEAYLRVRDFGGYHYRMEGATDHLPQGCEINENASQKHPWLIATELKALR